MKTDFGSYAAVAAISATLLLPVTALSPDGTCASPGIEADVKRTTYLIKTADCAFRQSSTSEKLPAHALWRGVFYCSEKRMYLRAYIFENQEMAIAFAESFLLNVEKTDRESGNHSRLLPYHRYTVNGRLLYMLRGDDIDRINSLLSHFAGEE